MPHEKKLNYRLCIHHLSNGNSISCVSQDAELEWQEVMPCQDSGDCSVEPGSLSSFGAELDLRQEHKQAEWFINNYTALVLHTLVLRIYITHMSDPIKSIASSIAHKMKAH